MEENKEAVMPSKESMAQLETISAFRYQMLAAQLKMNFSEGLLTKAGTRRPSTVRSINRIFWTAINQLANTGVKANPPINAEERRAVGTMVELLNGLMLQITLKEAANKAASENKQGENDEQNK